MKAEPPFDPMALLDSAAAIGADLGSIPDDVLAILHRGAIGLQDAVAALGGPTDTSAERRCRREMNRRRLAAAGLTYGGSLAENEAFSQIGDLDRLDDVLGFLIEGMQADVSSMTNDELDR